MGSSHAWGHKRGRRELEDENARLTNLVEQLTAEIRALEARAVRGSAAPRLRLVANNRTGS
jgi:hypothetical protein